MTSLSQKTAIIGVGLIGSLAAHEYGLAWFEQTADGWTYGALTNYLVSVAGDDDRADVDALFLQPFLARALGRGRTATVNFESTYDFERSGWTVPLNLTYSQVTKVGGQLVSFAVGGRAYLERPSGGPDWGVRFVVTLLYPK